VDFRIDDPGRFFRATGYGVVTRQLVHELAALGADFRMGAHLYPEDLKDLDAGLIPEDQRRPFLKLLKRSRKEPSDTPIVLQLCPPNGMRKPDAFRVLLTMTEREDWPERYPDWHAILENDVDLIVVPTEWNRDVFRRGGVTTAIEVCPLGIDVERFHPPETPPAEPPFTFLAIFQGLGKSSSREDWADLLSAWATAFGPDDPVRLVIRSGRSEPGFTVDGSGAPVELLLDDDGPLKEAAVSDLYRSAHVFVKSSVEGWGLPTMEALASGLVMVHCRGTAPDAYLDDDNALLFERGNPEQLAAQLRRAFDERRDASTNERRRAARATAERYTWRRAAERLAAILADAPQRAARGAGRTTVGETADDVATDTGPLKLEIGAGDKPQEGYVHHDIRPLPGIDVVCDAADFPAEHHGRYEEVYASNVLEHFSRFDIQGVLNEWVKLLKPGGVIKIIAPDVREIARQLISGHIDIKWFNYLMFGSNDYEHNVHKYGFDAVHLEEMLVAAGCEVVKTVPSRTWENRRLDKYCPMVTVWARKP